MKTDRQQHFENTLCLSENAEIRMEAWKKLKPRKHLPTYKKPKQRLARPAFWFMLVLALLCWAL